jgi:hypothetical protein
MAGNRLSKRHRERMSIVLGKGRTKRQFRHGMRSGLGNKFCNVFGIHNSFRFTASSFTLLLLPFHLSPILTRHPIREIGLSVSEKKRKSRWRRDRKRDRGEEERELCIFFKIHCIGSNSKFNLVPSHILRWENKQGV